MCVLVAHELRAWLLHYSPVILNGILLSDYYQHHLLLVEGVYLLLKQVVSPEDIQQSFRLLKHYCFMFSVLYGKCMVIRNLILRHPHQGSEDIGAFPWSCAPSHDHMYTNTSNHIIAKLVKLRISTNVHRVVGSWKKTVLTLYLLNVHVMEGLQ